MYKNDWLNWWMRNAFSSCSSIVFCLLLSSFLYFLFLLHQELHKLCTFQKHVLWHIFCMFTALWRLKQIIYRFLDAIKSFIYFSNFISIKTVFYFQLFGQFLFLGLFNFDIFFGFSFLKYFLMILCFILAFGQ